METTSIKPAKIIKQTSSHFHTLQNKINRVRKKKERKLLCGKTKLWSRGRSQAGHLSNQISPFLIKIDMKSNSGVGAAEGRIQIC